MYLLILKTKTIKTLVIYLILTTLIISVLGFLKISGNFYNQYVLMSFLLLQFYILLILVIRLYRKLK